MNVEQLPEKIRINQVLKQTFSYWNATLKYQFLFSVLYFGLLLVMVSFLMDYYEIRRKMEVILQVGLTDIDSLNKNIQKLSLSENYRLFQLMTVVATAFVYPLNIGFFKIFKKIDDKITPTSADLFEGYVGSNFPKYVGFYIFWGLIFYYCRMLVFPALFWVMITIFVAPLLYFTPMRLVAAISVSMKIVFANFLLIFLCVIIAFIFSYSGVLLFGFGLFFTFPFWNALIYSLFKNIIEVKIIEKV